jgi:hypothetical protein
LYCIVDHCVGLYMLSHQQDQCVLLSVFGQTHEPGEFATLVPKPDYTCPKTVPYGSHSDPKCVPIARPLGRVWDWDMPMIVCLLMVTDRIACFSLFFFQAVVQRDASCIFTVAGGIGDRLSLCLAGSRHLPVTCRPFLDYRLQGIRVVMTI